MSATEVESQAWAYLRSRLENGDQEESLAAANSMRLAHGVPVVGHGLTHGFYCTLRALRNSGVTA